MITSPANPQVKALVALRRRRVRDEEHLTVVEGYDELRLAIAAGVRPRSLFRCPELMTPATRDDPAGVVSAAGGGREFRLSSAAFAKAAYREHPDGWLAVVDAPGCPLAELTVPDGALLLVAEGVEKPGNLGAMLRTAEAAGVHAVLAADPSTDWGNPNVIRASKGTVFAVPVAAATTTATVEWLRDRGIAILVATPDAEDALGEVPMTGALAVVVGAEHQGVGAGWREAADQLVRIPMAGRVNSLNVATSAAVVLFEAVRQR